MSITPIGKSGKLWQLDFHPHRHSERVRRKIHGTKATALRVLHSLEERALAKQFGWPTQSDVTVKDLADMVVQDYIDNSRKSLKSAKELRKIWVDELGGKLAEDVSSDLLKDLSRGWMSKGMSSGRVNRRMSFILRGYSLALAANPPKITKKPTFRKLTEAAPRSGFFEWEDFERVRGVLPLHARIPVSIEYWTAMRSSEVLGLQWTQVRFEHRRRTVLIQLSDSKAAEPRLVAMGGDLYEVLSDWHQLSREQYPECPWICHYEGKRLGSIKTTWKTSCVAAGLGAWTKEGRFPGNRGYRGPTPHDFRRTGVRNLVRSGVPEKLAMKISGHKTRAVFDRYNIVNEEDLIEAGRRVVAHHEQQHASELDGGRTVDTPTPQTRKSPRQSSKSSRRAADS